MATIVLAAAGAAIGSSIGGAVLGVSSALIGKAIGATLGATLDQRLMGAGAAPVEVGRVDQFRVMGSREGTPIPRLYGQMRMAGQIIWSSRFLEAVTTSGGGKGVSSGAAASSYSYSISLAIALCEGEVSRIGRVWADGRPLGMSGLNWRLYKGDEAQLPDALIAASLPEGEAPAYRGTAYVVIEDLDLGQFGNRIPQFAFEVTRKAGAGTGVSVDDPAALVRGVALVPGTGEYALATEPVVFDEDKGVARQLNVNTDEARPDLLVALDQLEADLPQCGSVSLVVSWFGDDLRCDRCTLRPKVEQAVQDSAGMPWRVTGLDRAAAAAVSRVADRPGFGGTPADLSVVQAIREIGARGRSVMFYPFILMDIRAGNGLADPWGAAEQPPVPWRGRITLSAAPGQGGSPDGSAAAAAEVAAFFGTAAVADFAIQGDEVVYSGPQEWSYRRFILHYAHLCAAAGGVDSFCIGSEMRSLTQVRSARTAFPAVAALRALATDVRAVLGPDVKIGYAADWSEYFGYQPGDGSGDLLYHLDPLWSDADVDFVGIDNYMPLSDWRDGDAHADADAGSIYNLEYLRANVEGGEGYDWYYANGEARAAQVRLPIEDGAHGDPWVYRYKDIRNWWGRPHWNRIGAVRDAEPTGWVPEGKPVWFTELGCPAVDKGTNQPNVFLDPQSSETALPYHSSGGQDDFIQTRYLQAVLGYWGEAGRNPRSRVYDGPMLDLGRAHVWAWDARPWPEFPARLDVWSDGLNYGRGHWISGRTSLVALADVVREVTALSGLSAIDVSQLHGALRGFVIADTQTARASLQPLMLAYAFDAFDRGGEMVFRNRHARDVIDLDPAWMAVEEGAAAPVALTRAPEVEIPDLVRLGYVARDQDYQGAAVEARYPGGTDLNTARSDVPVSLEASEAAAIAERWLAETRVARDQVRFALPRSAQGVGLGDVVRLDRGGRERLFRIDRIEDALVRGIDAVRIEAGVYLPRVRMPEVVQRQPSRVFSKIHAEFLDLPLLTGSEVEHAPHVAVTAQPWPGPVAIYGAGEDYGYVLKGEVERRSVLGTLTAPLGRAAPGRWSGQVLEVRVSCGTLQGLPQRSVLNGGNAAALRFGGSGDWEVIQFSTATLIGPRLYRLTGLLRGQAGTEPLVPDLWPEGTDFVLLDGAAVQPRVAQSARGLERHFRVGPMALPYTDAGFVHAVQVIEGVGLRPYAPVHLAAGRTANGRIVLTWVRRTRADGDAWRVHDVPLGEAREAYVVRVRHQGAILREEEVTVPTYTYSSSAQAADGAPSPLEFEVAQVSDRFGPGLYARMTFNG